MPAPHPRMHGLTHVPGGPDPIPGLLTATGSYTERILAEPSLIGYWPLDDSGPPALDHSGSGHNLAEASAISPTYSQPGPFTDLPAATAVLFDVASGITTNTDTLADSVDSLIYRIGATNPYTWEILAYPTSVQSGWEGGLMSCYSYPSGSTGGVAIQILDTRKVRVGRAGSTWDTTAALTLNEWVHLAMTYDGATLRVYFDGVEELAQATATSHTGSGQLRIGSYWFDTARRNFHGRLAQAAIYNSALDASTIASHANAMIGGGGGGPAGGWPGSYPIVDADVAAAAAIAPTKLAHPGGTTTFLRADGTWATPAGPAVPTLAAVLAAGADAGGIAIVNSPVTINAQSASYTLVLTDAGKLVAISNASANNLTVPTNASVAFPAGTTVLVKQAGAGQTTVVASGGVTINSRGAALKLAGQYAYATLVKVATDTWDLSGDITT